MFHTQYVHTYIIIHAYKCSYLMNFLYAIFEMKVFLTILLNNNY